MNYNRIHSYHKFIEIMHRLNNDEKFIFLYNYFYKKVSYNYYEWLYGKLMHGITDFKTETINYEGELKQNKDTIMCYIKEIIYSDKNPTYKADVGDEIILQEIINKRKKYNLNITSEIDKYKNEVIDLLNNSFFMQLKNNEIKEQLFEIFKNKIINQSLVPTDYYSQQVLYDITWMIYKSFQDDFQSGKATYYNGLIRAGVCRHYAQFIYKILNELGIHTVNIIGKSKLIHEWNMVMINDEIRFIDITREIHLRNKANNYNSNKGDWYLITIDDMFNLEPDRDIRQINDVNLDIFITKNNYKEYVDVLYNAFNNKEKKKILK